MNIPGKHPILRSLCLLLAILALSPPAAADQQYEQCTAAINSEMELLECWDDYRARLDIELEQAVEEVLDMFKSMAGFDEDPDVMNGQDDFDILTYVYDEQEKWREYAKTTCLLFAARDNADRGARIFGSVGERYTLPKCRIFVIKQRIELLRRQACEFADRCAE